MAQPKPFDNIHDRHCRPVESQSPVLSPEEARQGVVSGRVLTILTSSLMLAAIAFAVVYSIFF